MNLEKLRELCLSFPGATEQIQWGADLVFKVGGKMFCVACTEVAPNVMSFKCDDEQFAELSERDGIIPAPYMARAKWVALERWDTLDARELEPLIERAYMLIRQKLPQKTQADLGGSIKTTARQPAKRRPTAVKARVARKSKTQPKRPARKARRG